MRPLVLLTTLLAGQVLAYPTPQAPPAHELAPRDWPAINEFLAKLTSLFPINILVQNACGTISAGGAVLGAFFGIPNTRNDACGDVTILFARGTCDPGNTGVLVGPWLFRSLAGKIGGRRLGVQGFDYPASVDGFLTGSAQNGVNLAARVRTTLQRCPNTKLVLSGYSQGGMVVHHAASNLDAATMSKVSAIVTFGDPYANRPFDNISPSKTRVFCNAGDNICKGGSIILLPHLTYATDAEAAANFIARLV